MEDTEQSFDVFEISLDEIRTAGDQVVGWGTIRIRGRGSGIETEVPTAAVGTVREGRILYLKDYGDRRKALEAVGLSD